MNRRPHRTTLNGHCLCLRCHVRSTTLWYSISHAIEIICILTSLFQYMLSRGPDDPRSSKLWADYAEYVSIQSQAMVDEKELLNEHQLALNTEMVGASAITMRILSTDVFFNKVNHLEGFSQHQWMDSMDGGAFLAQRTLRIRRLEDGLLHLRFRRAQLESSILAREMGGAKARLKEASKDCPVSLSPVSVAARAMPMTSRASLRRFWPAAPSFPSASRPASPSASRSASPFPSPSASRPASPFPLSRSISP